MKVVLRNGAAAMLAGWLICGPPARAAPPGPATVIFTVTLSLTGLHPAAQTGALDCGAVAQTNDWVAAHGGLLTDIDSVNHWALSPAHYVGNEQSVSFPIANRAYTGTQTFTTTLAAAAMTDPATHAAWQPGPAVLIACWLTINGRPAIRDPGSTPLVAGAGNFDRIDEPPLIAASAHAPPGSTVTASGQLAARGVYFVAGPVTVKATINTGGPAALPSPNSNLQVAVNTPVQAATVAPALAQVMRSQPTTSTGPTSTGAPPVASGLPPAASTVAGPVIQSLSENPAKVATMMMIQGSNFTNSQGQVTIRMPAYQKARSGTNIAWVKGEAVINPTIKWWSDTGVLIQIPDVPWAVLDPVGTVTVSNVLGESNAMSFSYVPYLCQEVPLNSGTVVHEAAVTGLGGKGDDYYLQGRTLANGWLVEGVGLGCDCVVTGYVCLPNDPDDCSRSRVTESHEGTQNMAVTVHWWYDAFQRSMFKVSETVEGVCYYDPYVEGKLRESLVDLDSF